MCRIFGFRSVIDSQVHSSLVGAENALMNQSEFHPDGWGVAYYLAATPHLIKSEKSALEDSLFKKVSGVVSSKTVLAHIRKSTVGENSAVNTHPFQHARWTFAHNGNIKNIEKVRATLLAEVAPELQKYILGNTDTELIFYLILTFMNREASVYSATNDLSAFKEAVSLAVRKVISIVGPLCEKDEGPNTENFLTFVMTDGTNMIAFQGGKNLFYSTYKKSCPEKNHCPKFNETCELPANGSPVNHLIFSSEPLIGENIWHPLDFGEMITINSKMNITQKQIL